MIIKEYNKFVERKVVSFDFDGVLHISTHPGTIDPVELFDWWKWEPNKPLHKILRQEHKAGNKIIIVTARNDWMKWMQDAIWTFCKKYNLPVDELVFTENLPKRRFLINKNVIRHYDDNFDMRYELDGTDIEFVYVYKDKIMRMK